MENINAEPSRVFEKAADFRAKIKSVIISQKNFICGNLWTKKTLWIKNSVEKNNKSVDKNMRKEDLRIVFMGTPEFAVETLDALVKGGYNVVAVVT